MKQSWGRIWGKLATRQAGLEPHRHRVLLLAGVVALLASCGGGEVSEDLRREPLSATVTATTTQAPVYDRDDLYRFFSIAFGAAPGVTYMGQLVEAADYGLTIKQIVNIFTTKPQFLETYPASLSNREYAQKLVDNVVGTSATAAAKAEAVEDIVAALSLPDWTRGDITYAIFNNLARKPADDAKWGATSKKMANQVAYAKYFTETMKVDTTYLSSLRAVVKNVTESTPTVGDLTAAINLAVEPTRIKLAAASSHVMGYTGMLGCGAASCINSIDLRTVSAKFGNDGQLMSYTNLANPTFEALSIGTASVSDLGGNADLTWGRWNAGTLSGTYGNQNFTKTGLRDNNGFHYVVGVNTATLPGSGKAEYLAIAATMPTVTTTSMEPAPGVLELSASRMVVDFASGKLGFEMAFSYPNYAIRGWVRTVLKSAGGFSDPAASAFSFGAGFTGLKAASGSGVNPVQYFADGADVTSYYGSRTTAYILPFGADASHLALIFYTYHKDAGIVIFKKNG